MPKHVLLIDPTVISRIRLSAVLEGGHHAITALASTKDRSTLTTEPDLIVVTISGGSPAAEIRSVRSEFEHSDAPILVLDADPTPMRRLAALRAGAREALPRSVPDALLLARLRGLIREGEAERECERRRTTAVSFGLAEPSPAFEPKSAVFVVDPADTLPDLPRILGSTLPYEPRKLGAAEALCHATDHVADAYVVVNGPDTQTLDFLLPELRDRSHSRRAPIMVVCPAQRPDIATRALDLGASELAAETATGEELALRLERMLAQKRMRDALRQSDEQSYRLAATDTLTGLYNRRYAEAYLGDLMIRTGGQGNFVVMLVDLDHFKEVNDRFGHAAGDRVLCEVAERLRDNLRACDLIARHGGEEFLVILPETQPDEAARTAERLRSAVADGPIELAGDLFLTITASIGVSQGGALGRTSSQTYRFGLATRSLPALSDVLEAADVALYRAKEFGRNRVEFSAA